MAPKRKKYQRKVGGTSPVVVIFLVLFILISLGLGAACYYGYAGQADLKKSAEDKDLKEKVAYKQKKSSDYYQRELRDAFGLPLATDGDEANLLKLARSDFDSGSGDYKDDKLRPVFQDAVKKMKATLGWDENTKQYKTNFEKLVAEQQAKIQNLEGQLAAKDAELAKANEQIPDIRTKSDKKFAEEKNEIAKDKAADMEKFKDKIKQVEEYNEKIIQLNKQITDTQTKHEDELREKDKTIAQLNKKYTDLANLVYAKSPGGPPDKNPKGPPVVKAAGKVHALMLDVSTGRPLWDHPKGKLLKVDISKREVIINLGISDGVKKEMTFNVFGPGDFNDALGPLKGTIEIKSVIDSGRSIGHITSLFDANGKEIPLFDPNKGAAERLAANPMKEGDLLFNMFWKSHVALAGRFNFSAYSSTSTAEDQRQLKLFMGLLQKEGIVVDSFIDPTTGKIEGDITFQTRFLILGEPLTLEKDSKGKAPNAALADEFNKNIATMKKEAADKGLFMISSYNFAFVSGYRPPGSADSSDISTFESRVPSAGQGLQDKLLTLPKDDQPPPPDKGK